MNGPASGDQLEIEIGQSGRSSHVSVNGQPLHGVTGVTIEIRPGELTHITLRLFDRASGGDSYVSGRFISEEDYREWQKYQDNQQP